MFTYLRSMVLFALCFMVAAPGVASAEPHVDTSASAQQQFFAWLNYENIVAEDRTIPAQKSYQLGVQACTMKARGGDTVNIIRTIEIDGGYTNVGSTAVYKAAVEALCTSYKGYKTRFDKDVATFMSKAGLSTTPPLVETDYGYFMRELCASNASTMDGLLSHIVTRRQLAIVQAFGNDAATMTNIISMATPCPALL